MLANGQNDNEFDFTVDDFVDAGVDAARDTAQAVGDVVGEAFEGISTAITQAMNNVAIQFSQPKAVPSPYVIPDSGAKMRGLGMTVVGGALVVVAAVTVVSTGVFSLFLAPFALGGGIGAAVVAAAGAGLIGTGASHRSLARDMDQISKAIGEQTEIGLDELAMRTGIPRQKLAKTLKRAMKRGMIPQGRVENVAGCPTLFLTQQAYEQRMNILQNVEDMRRQAVAREAAEASYDAQLSQGAQEALRACREFINRMDQASASINNQQTRMSIADLNAKVVRVQTHVRNHPSEAHRLQRFTSYYLPTTAKLAEAYAELDTQNATGSNAQDTRREVDEMLVLVSNATDKLLDDLLRSQNWDVASDASVMRTMLQQDGLTDNGSADDTGRA